ncbi:MAG: class I SAM-dependent methyltransferase [Alphaproteobacteria bacterium]|nr:class I SAM-dependent methyltransferase [Alphaproteobacteria bacterium]
MSLRIKKLLVSGKAQLNLLGLFIMAFAAFSIWRIIQSFTWQSLIPLVFLSYLFLRVFYELVPNRNKVPLLTTPFIGRRKIVNILKKDAMGAAKSFYKVVDLGSGRGELARNIAKAIPSAKVVGIEISRITSGQASLVQRIFGPHNLSYVRQDFFPYDCADVDAAVFYLNPSMARKAGEKLFRELKPGSLVISHTFPLEGSWPAPKVIDYRSPFKEKMYIYKKP